MKRRTMEMVDVNDDNNKKKEDGTFTMNMTKYTGNGLPSAQSLLSLIPVPDSGYLLKKNNSIWTYYLPCIFKQWKERFFIVIGNFLFRFDSENGEKPKGIPIPLDSSKISILNIDECTLEIWMIRKVYTLRASSKEECRRWVKLLNDRKAEAIRENLGHVPISKTVKLTNKVATGLVKAKLEKEIKEIESFNPMLVGLGKL